MVMWPFFCMYPLLWFDCVCLFLHYILVMFKLCCFVLDYVWIMRYIRFYWFINQNESTGCFLFNPQDHPEDQGRQFGRPRRAGAGTRWRRRSRRGARSRWGGSGRKWRRTQWRIGTEQTPASRARISSPRRQLTPRCRRQRWQELRWRRRPKFVSGSRYSWWPMPSIGELAWDEFIRALSSWCCWMKQLRQPEPWPNSPSWWSTERDGIACRSS